MLINGKVSGLSPSGKHGFQIHSNKLIGVDCQSAGDQFNSEDVSLVLKQIVKSNKII